MNRKVIVGMSGGVDSSVAAYILKEQGYEVEGVSLVLFDPKAVNASCCSADSAADAAKTAQALGISHRQIDVRGLFSEKVIKPFIEAYSRGTTPNPCILCNRHVKFPSLMAAADERGFGFVATGHYARTTHGEASLLRGIDQKKDQSYVLYALDKGTVGRLLLPLGEKTKADVRQMAHDLKLPAAKRPESQEICFIEERNYVSFMDHLADKSGGPVIDAETGEVLGRHDGIYLYTVGQRKRLPATGRPVYVVGIDIAKNTVFIGPRERAMRREFVVSGLNWLIPPRHADLRATVKVRSTMKDEPAYIHVVQGDSVKVEYDEPQWAPAPGQSAVFYNGDTVLGGGIIQ